MKRLLSCLAAACLLATLAAAQKATKGTLKDSALIVTNELDATALAAVGVYSNYAASAFDPAGSAAAASNGAVAVAAAAVTNLQSVIDASNALVMAQVEIAKTNLQGALDAGDVASSNGAVAVAAAAVPGIVAPIMATGSVAYATSATTAGTVTGVQSGQLAQAAAHTNRTDNPHAVTLQQSVTAGGTVTTGQVTIDAANTGTNTYGGYLCVLGARVRDASGAATGDSAWAMAGSTASGNGSWAMHYSLASDAGTWAWLYSTASGEGALAANYGTASGKNSLAINHSTASSEDAIAFSYGTASGNAAFAIRAKATNDLSFAWSGQSESYGSHGDGTFSIDPVGGWLGLYVGETNLYDLVSAASVSHASTSDTATALDPAGADGIRLAAAVTNNQSGVTLTNLTLGGTTTAGAFKPPANSTSAFGFSDATGLTNTVVIDTKNARMGIGLGLGVVPTAPLVVNNAAAGVRAIFSAAGQSSGYNLTIYDNEVRANNNNFSVTAQTAGYSLIFKQAGSEKMRLWTNGYLGVATAAPTEVLHVTGNAVVSGDVYLGPSIGGSRAMLRTDGTNLFYITAGGGITNALTSNP